MMTKPQLEEQLKYYGVPASQLEEATNYALELIDDRGEIDLSEFVSAWREL